MNIYNIYTVEIVELLGSIFRWLLDSSRIIYQNFIIKNYRKLTPSWRTSRSTNETAAGNTQSINSSIKMYVSYIFRVLVRLRFFCILDTTNMVKTLALLSQLTAFPVYHLIIPPSITLCILFDLTYHYIEWEKNLNRSDNIQNKLG